MKFHGHELLDGMRHLHFVVPQKCGRLRGNRRNGRMSWSSIIEEAISIVSRRVEGHQTGVKPPNVQTESKRLEVNVEINNDPRDSLSQSFAQLPSRLCWPPVPRNDTGPHNADGDRDGPVHGELTDVFVFFSDIVATKYISRFHWSRIGHTCISTRGYMPTTRIERRSRRLVWQRYSKNKA